MKLSPLPKCECQVCGCDESVVLTSNCHPGEGTEAFLSGDVLTLYCKVCGRVVTRLLVTHTVQLD